MSSRSSSPATAQSPRSRSASASSVGSGSSAGARSETQFATEAGGNKSPARSAASSRSSSRSSRRSSRSSSPRSVSRSPSRSRSRSASPADKAASSPSRSKSRSRSRSRSASASPASSRSASSASSASDKPKGKAGKLKVQIKKKAAAAKSDSEEGEAHSDEDDDDDKPSRGRKATRATPAKKAVKAKGKKGKNAAEEGEASSEEEQFDDGMDDDLIRDEEDRARLEKMTEREREEELFKRAEERENQRKRFEIKKKMDRQKKEQQQSGKKEAVASSDDDFDYGGMIDAKERSQDRRKTVDALKFDKKSSALSELKAKKQERERKEQARAAAAAAAKSKEASSAASPDEDDDDSSVIKTKAKKKTRRSSQSSSDGEVSDSRRSRSRSATSSSSSSSRSSSSSSGKSGKSASDSDTERFDEKSSRSRHVVRYVETLSELEPVRLSRFKMERFVHMPFFKRLVLGCFVRIGIGQHEGRSIYRCTEITDVVETAKVYQVGSVRTNIGLKLRFGVSERVFRLEFVSNSPLTPSEFQKWREASDEASLPVPTREFVQTKSDEIRKALNYEYSSADVDAIIEKKSKFQRHPVNYAMQKARLMKEKEMAQAEHDDVKAAEMESKLHELEERAEELDRRRYQNSSISSVGLLNNRNRKDNIEKAEKAIHEEIRRKKEEGVESNPFTRRKCNPRMVTKNEGPTPQEQEALIKQLSEKENRGSKKPSVPGHGADKRKPGPAPASSDATDSGSGGKKPRLGDDHAASGKEDLFDAHNFDIEIDMGGAGVGLPASVVAASVADDDGDAYGGRSSFTSSSGGLGSRSGAESGPPKRALNLADYKKKRGLI